METPLVRAYQRNEKYRRKHRAHIEEHRMHGGIEKRYSGTAGQAHLEIHRAHARRCHSIPRDREAVVKKRNGRKQGGQDEEGKPERQKKQRQPQRKGKNRDKDKIQTECHDPPRADGSERLRRKLWLDEDGLTKPPPFQSS